MKLSLNLIEMFALVGLAAKALDINRPKKKPIVESDNSARLYRQMQRNDAVIMLRLIWKNGNKGSRAHMLSMVLIELSRPESVRFAALKRHNLEGV